MIMKRRVKKLQNDAMQNSDELVQAIKDAEAAKKKAAAEKNALNEDEKVKILTAYETAKASADPSEAVKKLLEEQEKEVAR
jgi:hypothetical protein